MAGRIRTIKPEMLEDAITAGLSDMAFRLFVAAILLADDYGRLRSEPGWLMGQIYWAKTVDPASFVAAMGELDRLVNFYEINSQKYAEIRNWAKHQKVSHKGKPRIPPPSESPPSKDGDPPEGLRRPSGETHESLVPDLRSPTNIPPTNIPPTEHVRERSEASRVPDPTQPEPDWWAAALGTVSVATAVDLPPGESWLRYAGHRNNKRLPATQPDAVQWLTAVMVREARDQREKARAAADRESKWERARAGPRMAPDALSPPTEAEAKANAEKLARRIAERKARESKGAA